MSSLGDESQYQAIRAEKLVDLASEDMTLATRALLYLTYEDPDRQWLEDLLIKQSTEDNYPQLRSLAVTCMGHIGRMRGIVSRKIVSTLEDLLADKSLAGIAEDALDDIEDFAEVD